MTKSIDIEPPIGFSFRHTVYSHGWSELPPFALDEASWKLTYVFSHEIDEIPVFATLYEVSGAIRIDIETNDLSADAETNIVKTVKHILRFDENLLDFYKLANRNQSLKWISSTNAGRLIRSPTVFEDLVKTICTTNCSWGLTKIMTKNLVDCLGVAAANGRKTFPTADSMANQNESFYREEIRAGYRSPYFVELVESVANGKIDPEGWLHSELPTAELKKEMKQIKGVGDYAAENLLKLVGRYDGLALDSFLRSQFYKKHNGTIACDDKKIEKFYEKFGTWRGLAIWCDMTERWFKFEN